MTGTVVVNGHPPA